MIRYVSFALTIIVAVAIFQMQNFTKSRDAEGSEAYKVRGAGPIISNNDKEKALRSVISQLEIMLSGQKIKARKEKLQDLKTKALNWKQTRSGKDWLEVTDEIYNVSKNHNLTSIVTIKSFSPNKATTIKYQTFGQRNRNVPPTTAINPGAETMYLGIYYIWSERGGKPTSDKDAQFYIAEPKARVTLKGKK
jgi:hypothetical protein